MDYNREELPLAPSLDGNTVDSQMEESAFAENNVRYEAALTFIEGDFNNLNTVISANIAGPSWHSPQHIRYRRLRHVSGVGPPQHRGSATWRTPTASATARIAPARRRCPVFQAVQDSLAAGTGPTATADASVKVDGIVQSTTPGTASYDPGNPLADANGYVYSSNVNVVEQMADIISASRSYQNDADVLNTSKQLMLDTLKLRQ